MHWPATVAALTAAVVVLAGCHTDSPTTRSPTLTAPSVSAAGATDNLATPASAPVVWSDGSTAAAPNSGRLGLEQTSRGEALDLAEQAMTLYARPWLSFDVWWDGLAPLLSAQGALAYSTVDPTSIPVSAVTGSASLPGWDTPEVARVSVPTDVGAYLVIVSRNETDPVWRVERFIAPEVLS